MRKRACAAFWALCAVLAFGGAARGEERPFAVERLLPGDAAAGVRLEAALLVRDLRAQHAEAAAQRDRLRRTAAGAAFLDPASLKRDFGFDFLEELGRWVELGAPKGKPLPAAVALWSGPGGFGVQLILDAAPGFAGRLEQALRAGTAPAGFRPTADGLMRFEIAGTTLVGREGADGSVRFAPTEVMLAGAAAAGDPLFPEPIAARVRDCRAVLYFPGGGRLAERLAGKYGEGGTAAFVRGARGLALGIAGDGAGTEESRIVLDHPLLGQFGPLLAAPEADNPFPALWGEQATALFALRLPPAVIAPGLILLSGRLAQARHPAPPALLEALQSFDGRVSFARFGSPGDWALGLHFADEKAAAALVPALQSWLGAVGEAERIALLRSLVREALPGAAAAQTLSFGPDAGLARIGLTSIGRALVLTPQPQRRQALLAAQGKKGRAGAKSPLTAPMRAALAKDALLASYQVLGNELAAFGATEWLSLVLRETLRAEARTRAEAIPLLDAVVERIPALMALASAGFDLTYDSLVRADVEGTCLVVQTLSSELPAKGRYFEAVNRRLAGDPAGYYDGLIAVAAKDAEGREGRRARAALLYNPFSDLATVGMLAAVAVPNFLKLRERAARAAEPGRGEDDATGRSPEQPPTGDDEDGGDADPDGDWDGPDEGGSGGEGPDGGNGDDADEGEEL